MNTAQQIKIFVLLRPERTASGWNYLLYSYKGHMAVSAGWGGGGVGKHTNICTFLVLFWGQFSVLVITIKALSNVCDRIKHYNVCVSAAENGNCISSSPTLIPIPIFVALLMSQRENWSWSWSVEVQVKHNMIK